MTRDYFRQGGPFNVRRTGDRLQMDVPIEGDEDGRVARQCPDGSCSPGYFKIRYGTGITDEQEFAYCPYCRHQKEPNGFLTEEQTRYLHDVALHEAAHAVQNMFKRSLQGSKAISYKPGRISAPRRPFEDEVQRDVVCPHCTLDHAVYGLATWCPDCGADIFLTHVETELNVVRTMLGDIERRQETLGRRVAAKDLENCLEDIVSIFEAVLKALFTRHLEGIGHSKEEILQTLKKKVQNGFQSVERAQVLIVELAKYDLYSEIEPAAITRLKDAFERRHPITHNLGVVDRKYIERSMQEEQEGREIRISKKQIVDVIDIVTEVIRRAHRALIAISTPNQESSDGAR